jgi:putative oxidoreductase
MTDTAIARAKGSLNVPLWIAQGILAATYGLAASMKVSQPIPKLAAMMGWPGGVPEALVRFVGSAELAGAIGLILPMVTRVQPRLTVFAAVGLIALQLCAMAFHISRSEFQMLPINLVLVAIPAFIAWGRRSLLRG